MIRRISRHFGSMPQGTGWMLVDTLLMTSIVLATGVLFWAVIGALRGVSLDATLNLFPQAITATLSALTPSNALAAVRYPTILAALLFFAIFYIPYRKELGLGAVRDVLVVLLYTAFMALLFQTLGHQGKVPPEPLLDALLLTAAGSTFLVVSISNFGGLNDSSKDTAVELAVMAAVVFGAEALGLLGNKSWSQVITSGLLDLAVIYVLSFCTKWLLFPGDFITFTINSALGRTLFGLSAILFLLPVVAMLLTLIGIGLYAAIRMVTGGPAVVFAYPPFAPVSPVLGSTAYVIGLMVTNPLAALGILVGVFYSVFRFAGEHAAQSVPPSGLKLRLGPAAVLVILLGVLGVLAL